MGVMGEGGVMGVAELWSSGELVLGLTLTTGCCLWFVILGERLMLALFMVLAPSKVVGFC